MAACDYLIPQKTPEGYVNSYYSLGVKYLGADVIGAPWKEFRAEYIRQGGDGIYGAWSVPYLEPVIAERQFVKRLPEVYEKVHYPQGLCPVAERIQPQLMQFKTNYRDLGIAEEKARALQRTIRKFSS